MADYVKRDKAGEKWESLEMISIPPNSPAQRAFTLFRVCQINSSLVPLAFHEKSTGEQSDF